MISVPCRELFRIVYGASAVDDLLVRVAVLLVTKARFEGGEGDVQSSFVLRNPLRMRVVCITKKKLAAVVELA